MGHQVCVRVTKVHRKIHILNYRWIQFQSVWYLELQHPGAVPVGHIAPFDKELPLPAACKRRGVRSISREVSRPRDRGGGGWLPPSPC